jgi:hypothetical protein
MNAERGLSSFDVRHNFSMSLSYDIPTPRIGYKPLEFVLSRWSMDGIVSARTGFPLTVTMSQQIITGGGNSGTTVRPDIVPGEPIWTSTPYQYFNGWSYGTINPALQFGGKVLNPKAFSYAYLSDGSGRVQGNEPRGYFTGPGATQVDWTIRRQFKLTEKYGLQWRLDIFNLLNGGTTLSRQGQQNSPNANLISSILAPRVVRFGVRLTF